GRIAGSGERPDVKPIGGSTSELAESLARFEAVGIAQVQVVLDPIDAQAVTEMGEVLALLQ
ncbi:MAG: hypothetical protein ABWZ58_10590, partial [Acidimicrobiia bacterium]